MGGSRDNKAAAGMTAGLRWQQQQQQIPRVEVPIRDLSNLPYSLDDSSSSSFSPKQQLKEGGIEKKRGEEKRIRYSGSSSIIYGLPFSLSLGEGGMQKKSARSTS